MSRFFWVVVCLSMTFRTAFGADVVRINQMGYLPNSMKVAVFLSDKKISVQTFAVHEASSGKTVFSGTALVADGHPWGKESAYRLPFSAVVQEGRYYIEAGDALSPQFAVSSAVYKGTADYILNYMRQQRCGFNPFLGDSCHTKDGIITDHPTKTGSWMDAKGGWHDASDYLQYVLTSANAVYQLLFAYRSHPESYGDQYDANGKKGANGIPDILDEARWGLNWLMKMNPAPGEMYYQIADDRDHRGFRLPTLDTVSYGLGKQYRPVYYVTGKPQGTGVHRNRTTGVSSVAAKFSSSF
ncbi:MAG: glycoside hydrolase family 9 protein, partial [Marinilabiliales bacterium]|nr:glycoside hydrolase family 9 protein [Marinilabiliales bacterium]